MWLFKTIVAVFVVILSLLTAFSGPSQIYLESMETPFYKDHSHVYTDFQGPMAVLTGVDPASFVVICDQENEVSEWIVKDKNHVYYEGDSSGEYLGWILPRLLACQTQTEIHFFLKIKIMSIKCTKV